MWAIFNLLLSAIEKVKIFFIKLTFNFFDCTYNIRERAHASSCTFGVLNICTVLLEFSIFVRYLMDLPLVVQYFKSFQLVVRSFRNL